MINDIPEDAAESAPPADPVVAGETYIHWKHGREYVVRTIAMGNSVPLVGIDVVVYRPVDAGPGDRDYARTRADFTSLVLNDAYEVVRRFRLKPKAAPSVAKAYAEGEEATSTDEPKGTRTDETCRVESLLRAAGFEKVDVYRFNAASIRVRVASASFDGRDDEARARAVEMCLDRLPERTQGAVLFLLTLTPAELAGGFECCNGPYKLRREAAARQALNVEFESAMPPADGEVTNADRRRWARAALEAYMRAKDVTEDGHFAEESLCLMTDLLHFRSEIAADDCYTSGAIGAIIAANYEDEARIDD